MDGLISQVAAVQALGQYHDTTGRAPFVGIDSRIDRLEVLLMASPVLSPSVDEVSTELLAKKKNTVIVPKNLGEPEAEKKYTPRNSSTLAMRRVIRLLGMPIVVVHVQVT